MSSPSPICVNCNQEMQCERNGRIVHDPKVGDFPATYWVGDEFKCPLCQHSIVVGFARKDFTAEELKNEKEYKRAVPFVHSLEQRHLLKQYGVINEA